MAWGAADPLPHPRSSAAAGTIDGKLYVAFGYYNGAAHDDLFVYDPDTGSWSSGPSAPEASAAPVASGVIDGVWYVAGLFGAAARRLYAYDPTVGWSRKTAPDDVYSGSITGVIDGKLYVANSGTLQIYDPDTDSWSTSTATTPTGLKDGVGGVIDGKLYVATNALAVHIYDPVADSWSTGADGPAVTVNGSAGNVIDDKLYISGAALLEPVFYIYDQTADAWTSQLPPPVATTNACGAVENGVLYVIGGQDSDGTVATVYTWDTAQQPVPDFVGSGVLTVDMVPVASIAAPFTGGSQLFPAITGAGFPSGLWRAQPSRGDRLHAAIDDDDTTLVLYNQATGEAEWSTASADYPIQIQIDGEQISLPAAPVTSGGLQTWTSCVRGINGTVARAHQAGAPVGIASPGHVGY